MKSKQVDRVDADVSLGQFHVFPAPGQIVSPSSADFDGRKLRRALRNDADEFLDSLSYFVLADKRRIHHHGFRRFRIIRRRGRSEFQRCLVNFHFVHQRFTHPRRPADQQQQHAGGEWIERSGMANLRPARQEMLDARHRAGGTDPRWFIEIDDPLDRFRGVLSFAGRAAIVVRYMLWHKPGILSELRRLHKAGKALSYNAVCRSNQALLSASAYHFKSYRRAVEAAGIDYLRVLRRPRWTRQRIITLIKSARRAGESLNWLSVTRRRDELGRAAFASLQPRLFGSWQRAIHAAGLDGDEIARYRRWDKNTIAFELKEYAADGDGAASGIIQTEDPGLHAAALRHFGSFDAALRYARLDPAKIRVRQKWNKILVKKSLQKFARKESQLTSTNLRNDAPALYGAVLRHFGSFKKAQNAIKRK